MRSSTGGSAEGNTAVDVGAGFGFGGGVGIAFGGGVGGVIVVGVEAGARAAETESATEA